MEDDDAPRRSIVFNGFHSNFKSTILYSLLQCPGPRLKEDQDWTTTTKRKRVPSSSLLSLQTEDDTMSAKNNKFLAFSFKCFNFLYRMESFSNLCPSTYRKNGIQLQ